MSCQARFLGAYTGSPEGVWFTLVLSSGTTVSACSSARKGNYFPASELIWINKSTSWLHPEPGIFTKQQCLFKTNCLGLTAEYCPFGTSGPKHQAVPASWWSREMLLGLWELEAVGRQSPAMAPSVPHLHGRAFGALHSSPPHYRKEKRGRWSSGTQARFLLCALEKHRPSNASPCSPLAFIHSLPLCPRFISHYSPPLCVQAPTQCIKCQFKGIIYKI